MHLKYLLAASTAAVCIAAVPGQALAQSTGSIEFEKEIVVTGGRTTEQAVAGVAAPDTSKAKAVLTSENIQRQNPGQTVLDTINQVPGVSFQNNDAYGSAGGTLNIRGFSSDRVSLTFDGVPLNDSGNYAIFSQQQVDPEVIEQVNVNLGTTDVDSPTASAAGGTVNLRTKTPDRELGAMLSGSVGEYNFWRLFGKIETGDLTSSGLRAWVSASRNKNRVPFNNYGKIDKQQYNFKIYQPLGGSDFIAISGHYNVNRNNFFGSLPLRSDTTRTITLNGVSTVVPRIVGSAAQNRYPASADERRYLINYPCSIAPGVAGTADPITVSRRPDGSADVNSDFSSCGTEFDRRYNPSKTGNIRISSRFTLTPNLVLTVDPSFQWVKANGGGTVSAREGLRDIDPTAGVTNVAGYLGGTPFFGRDINGDGDLLDTVSVIAPSQTATRRFGLIAGLRWNINDHHTVRINYTLDHARHRQTGEVALLQSDGEPVNIFAIDAAQKDVNGANLQKRDRLSYAILHQFSAEYRGEFFDNRLVFTAGLRMPFFKRDLTNNCFTSSAGGFVECFGTNTALNATAATLNPYVVTTNATTGAITVTGWSPPQHRVINYKKALPNVGVVFDLSDNASVFANFSQGISVPSTDNLYNAFFFPFNTDRARPAPETTDNFDIGFRYRSGTIQGQISAFYNKFHNRLASAYDPEINQTVYRNLGDVKKYGIDGSVAWQPIPQLTIHMFGSILKSEIRDNLAIGENLDGTPVLAQTAGKRESGAPKYTFGFSARGEVGPFELGITAKRTGERFIYDTNEATFTGSVIALGAKACANATTCVTPTATPASTQIYGAVAPAYWLVNLDARYNLESVGLPKGSHLQLNVYNLFNQFYVGGYTGNLNQTLNFNTGTGLATYGNPGFVQIGAPRTVSGTLVVSF